MSDELHNNEPPEEPSVLDYVKSLFRFGGAERIHLPKFADDEKPSDMVHDHPLVVSQPQETTPPITNYPLRIPNPQSTISNLRSLTRFPWRSLLALLLALLGQRLFEPPPGNGPLGYAFYLAAFSLLGWAIYVGEWTLAPHAPTSEGTDPLTYRPLALFISVLLGLWAFVVLGGNLFTKSNVIIWILAVAFFIW